MELKKIAIIISVVLISGALIRHKQLKDEAKQIADGREFVLKSLAPKKLTPEEEAGKKLVQQILKRLEMEDIYRNQFSCIYTRRKDTQGNIRAYLSFFGGNEQRNRLHSMMQQDGFKNYEILKIENEGAFKSTYYN